MKGITAFEIIDYGSPAICIRDMASRPAGDRDFRQRIIDRVPGWTLADYEDHARLKIAGLLRCRKFDQ